MDGLDYITQSRRQQLREGFDACHDDKEQGQGIAVAASIYAMPDTDRDYDYDTTQRHPHGLPRCWPWQAEWWKPSPDDRIKELAKAGALCAAEIDRLLRQKERRAHVQPIAASGP